MQVAEIGKIYTYNGKKYLAQKPNGEMSCVGCSLFRNRCAADGHVRMMCDGLPYTCIDMAKRDCVFFVEVKK